MADDLKPMLSKLLASKGEKRFYFAYGTGKRKDGKGEGELAVRGKKIKKAEIEAALADCKQVLEGFCWTGKGADDSAAVYFKGKGTAITATVVSRMAKTAKGAAGRAYDFRIPSPEEEERAENLQETDGEEAPITQEEPTAPPVAPPPPPGGDAAFKTRLKAITDKLSAAGGPTPGQQFLLNQAYSAAGDKNFAAALEALKKIDSPESSKKEKPETLESTTFKRALAALKPRFDKARAINSDLMPQLGNILALAKDNNYVDALEMLDKLEVEVDRTLASVPKPAPNGDAFKARLKALLPKYNAAIKEDAALLAQVKPLMSQVIAQSNANQFDQALPNLILIEKALGLTRRGDEIEAVMLRFNGMKPGIKTALGAGDANGARIQTLVGVVGGLLKNKDAVEADKVLDELEPLLKSAEGTGTADPAAEWKTKLAQWSPAIKKALADKGPNAAAIAKLFAQATAQSKSGGDMTEALAKLTECHTLATAETPEEEASEESQEEEADQYQEMYLGLLSTLPGDLNQLRKLDAATATRIDPIVTAAAGHEKKGDYKKAFTFLNQAATTLATALSAARAQDAKDVIPEGKVEAMKAALTQAQSKWDAALTAARARLKPVQAALQSNFPSAAAGVKNILDSYEQDLLDELQAGQALADEEGLAAAVTETLVKVQSLRAEATGDKVFNFLDKCGVPVKAVFTKAFDEVESLLQA